jgi:predicted secreted Zn-dependent protease
MEKALEIEKIKQECETIKSEFGKLKQKELRTNDKCKQLDGMFL